MSNYAKQVMQRLRKHNYLLFTHLEVVPSDLGFTPLLALNKCKFNGWTSFTQDEIPVFLNVILSYFSMKNFLKG